MFESAPMQISVTDGGVLRDYYVHKELLLPASRYFAAHANFREEEASHLALDGVNHHGFDNVLNWLYRGSLPPESSGDPHVLIHTWITADRLLMNGCKNFVMDELQRLYKDTGATGSDLVLLNQLQHSQRSTLTKYIYDQLSFDLITRQALSCFPVITQQMQGLPIGMAFKLIHTVAILARRFCQANVGDPRTPRNPADQAGCSYHHHILGDHCPAVTRGAGPVLRIED